MKQGRSIAELAAEIKRQEETKRDFVADTRNIVMHDDARITIGDKVTVGVNDLAHGQIAGHAKIPQQYYDRMRTEAPNLLANNVNEWFRRYPTTRMARTLDDHMRGFLSDRYRPLDNFDLFEAAMPRIEKMKVMVMSCEVTETRMYLKIVDERIKMDLPKDWSIDNRGHARFGTVSPALVLSNSEVGAGALSCQTSIYFGGCTNLTAIKEGSIRKFHLGSKHELGDDVYRLLSDTTKKITDQALWAQIGDVVGAAFNEAQFKANLLRLKQATEDKIEGDPIQVGELTGKRFGLNDKERCSVLLHLIQNGDLSKFGLHNAITRAAQDQESYDRASQLEQLGGVVVELPKREWKELNKEAVAEAA